MPRGANTSPVTRVICGPERSLRLERVLAQLREHAGSALLLVPGHRLASQRLEQLLLSSDVPGMWGRPVETFQTFAMELLGDRDLNVNLLDEFERRAILEHAIDGLRGSDELAAVGDAAATPGFVSHMLRVITQLKQAAIEPAEFRARVMESGRHHWLDPVVAAVYEVYQAALIESRRYDLVGLYWQAEVACRERRPAVLDTVRHVVLDGFDDFTPSEFRLLEAVAPQLESLSFSMSCSVESASQRDLYATPRETVRRILQTLSARVEEFEEPPPVRFSDYLRRHLFWRDFPDAAPGGDVDVALAVYTNPVNEIEGVARAAKRLIIDEGVVPQAIAVVYRDLSEHADAIRMVFDEAGVPVNVDERPPLTQSGIGRFVLAVLDIASAWRRDAVVDVLTSPYFAPNDLAITMHRASFPALARFAKIIGDRRDWEWKMRALPGVIARAHARDLHRLGADTAWADAASAMQGAWKALGLAVDSLDAARSDAAYVIAIRRAVEALGCRSVIDTLPDEAWRERERSAWEAFDHLLDTLGVWAERGTASGDAKTRFRQALGATSYSIGQPRDGVQVLSVEAARYLEFDHVFFCGLVEGAMPKPPAASAIYTDRDVEAFEKVGVALESRQGRNARERLLFHHGLSLAKTRVYLSWHARSRQDKEVGASPFIADVRELAGDRLRIQDMRLAPMPSIDAASSPRELLNAAMAEGVAIPAIDETIQRVADASAIERRRYGSDAFDAYDGRIADVGLLERVRNRFNVDYQFSARQLEAYARCPFRFFAQEVFRLEPVEEPAPEIDPMLRGQIMHAALQQFHESFRGKPIATIEAETAAEAMRGAVVHAWDRLATRDRATPPAVRATETARLTAQLLRYVDIERAAGDAWRPAHFEVSFGRTVRDRSDPWSRDEPFVLETPAGQVPIGGVIDRIDEGAAGARIIDYKNSISIHSNRAIDDGVDLQLLLYAEALEGYLAEGHTCVHAQYVHVGRKDVRECLGDEAPNRRQRLREKIAEYVQSVRDGRFHPTPYHDSCTYCSMRRVCRYDAGRIARKEAGA